MRVTTNTQVGAGEMHVWHACGSAPGVVDDGVLAEVGHAHLHEQVAVFRILPKIHIRHL